jgi:hypothetical protein
MAPGPCRMLSRLPEGGMGGVSPEREPASSGDGAAPLAFPQTPRQPDLATIAVRCRRQ